MLKDVIWLDSRFISYRNGEYTDNQDEIDVNKFFWRFKCVISL